MKTRSDDWDAEERDSLKSLERELDALRTRHAADPALELLRAARGDVLPEGLQARVNTHLSESAWSHALVEGAEAVEVSLTPDEEQRLLGRIQNESAAARPRSLWSRMWIPTLATAAIAVLVAVVLRRADLGDRSTPPTGAPPTVPSAPAPTFSLSLSKPDIKLSPAALTYRGAPGGKGFLAEMKPALDAFRQSDYAGADRAFASLASRYPRSVEIPFYQGVARLFLNDFSGAEASLTAADQNDRNADASFAPDIAWYRAIADERLGRVADARARLTALCSRVNQPRQTAACEAVERLK